MSKRLFVGGLPYSTSEADLKELFEKIGVVTSCDLITDKFTNQSKGFAFVEMENDADADSAIEKLNNSDLGGRKIVVSIARPREERINDFGRNNSYGSGGYKFQRDRNRGQRRY